MTPRELLEELHATITTLTAERDQAINEHARVDQLNKFLKEEVRVLSGKLKREALEGNRLREEVRRLMTPPQTGASEDVWDDVTHECVVTAGVPEAGVGRTIFHYHYNEYIDVMHARHLHEYRLRHTGPAGDALIIERKRS